MSKAELIREIQKARQQLLDAMAACSRETAGMASTIARLEDEYRAAGK